MRVRKRCWAFILAVCVLLLSVGDIAHAAECMSQSASTIVSSSSDLNTEVKNKILSYQSIYPEGVNWDPNGNGWKNLAWQCYGFALTLMESIFQSHPTNSQIRSAGNGEVVAGWTCYYVTSSNYNTLAVEPGDVIDCPTSSQYNHTAMVLSVDNGNITCVQANWGGDNAVYWTSYFNYNNNRKTLKNIYDIYSQYITGSGSKVLRLWKPSEELKIQATGYTASTAPTITNVVVTDVDKTGYTVTVNATDNVGVTKVEFGSRPKDFTLDKWVWQWGTQNADGSFSARIGVSDFGDLDYTYATTVWAYNTAGNISTGWEVEQYIDTTAPTITNVVVTDVDATGYTVTVAVSDNNGVTNVRFPTRRADEKDDAWRWYDGTRNADGTYSKRIDVSELNSVNGTYYTHVYAYDACGNISAAKMVEQYVDTMPPVISDIQVTDVDGSGYTVQCTVTDNVDITKVQFPTWTSLNGQDDLLLDWEGNSAVSGTANGNVYTFHVKDIDHNFERGVYETHIYAYDSAGNHGFASTSHELKNEGKAVAEAKYNGNTYKLIDDKLTWHEAKAACEALGGHLVTITSAEEQQAIESILPTNVTCYGYFIGGYTENGTSKWVTGEDFAYHNFVEGQPDGYVDDSVAKDVYVLKTGYIGEGSVGQWNDVVYNAPGYGYICEFEPTPVTSLTLSESETEVGLGQTKTLEAITSPAEGSFPDIIWTSANEGIATVSDGVITGVAAGTTTITAECGGKTASCMVKIVKPFESISLDITDKSLSKNETCKLEVTFAPADANASTDLVWTSSNSEVATVNDKGVVFAQRAGNTTITATLKNNHEISATCTVQVESYIVTFDTMGGSSIPNVECGKNELLSVPEPAKSGYAFTGWYKDAECTIPWDMENDVVNGNLTLYAGWMEYHEGLWIVDIPAQKYTGKAIKPKVMVYHYAVKLEEGKDYKISYKNNTNAADKSDAKAPTVIVQGKGNYTGKETAAFTILSKDISEEDITADNIYVAANGKVQNPSPAVTWNNKKLKKDKDFTVEYPDKAAGAYQNNGIYEVRIVGKGNFCGERTVQFQITGSNLISKVKVSKIANQTYTGKEIEPEFTVKYGSATLTKGIDYTVSYKNNIATGTATATLKGMGSYSGEKKVNFKIVGISISKAKVTQLPESVVYDGSIVNDVNYQLQMEIEDKTVDLVESQDYKVSYKNNSAAGTATICFHGINGYSGTLMKTFKITAYDIGVDTENTVNVSQNLTVPYMKGSTVVEPKVTCFGKLLKKGKDYTLSYKNNKKISANSSDDKTPTVIISGKGNYSGKITLTYSITEQDIGLLSMTAVDKVYQNATGKYVSKPIIKDVNGKKLSAGTDYEKELLYTYTADTTLVDGTIRMAGTSIEASDILPAGTSVTVTAKGKGNYNGEISCNYRIVQADISKGKGKIATQIYTGKAIEPDKSDITLKVGKTTLEPTDYEIVSYSNNIKKGTATVVVRGVGNYGGTKTIKFKISSLWFSWWWR